MKIIYCGYDFFSSCLQRLLDAEFDIVKVFSFPCTAALDSNTYIRDICHRHRLPYTEQRIDSQVIEQFAAGGADILVTAGYPYKIPDLSEVGIRGINVHPTFLPQGKGVWPLPWIVLKGLDKAGVSIHKLTAKWDSGDILLQEAFDVSERDNLESLSAKSQIKAEQLIATCFQDFDRYWRLAKAQTDPGDYWGYPSQRDRTIDWHAGFAHIDRTCRAFGKAGCFASFADQVWMVYALIAWPEQHQYTPGAVVHKTNTEMIVATTDGLCSMQYFEAAPNIQL